jgi:two-component system, LytTR family, sensor kinase
MKTSPTLKVISHCIVWLLFFALILSVTVSMGTVTMDQQLLLPDFYVFCLVYLFVFYVNWFFLFPYLYLHKKYVAYFLIILLMLYAVYLITPFDHLLHRGEVNSFRAPPLGLPARPGLPPFRGPGERPFHRGHFIDLNSIIIFLLVWLASMALQILKEWRSSQQRALIAESDKKAAELAFLKAHINPHFLFNTLNNIYSLAVTNHEQTAVSVLKLSNIMRYVTESAAIDFIALENEVECIVDYVDLQKLRLSSKVYLDFSITGAPLEKVIAPLILMTFVENAFKYGISNHYQSTITIKLFIEEEMITFYCQNKIFNPGYVYDREGWGISNARRRLEYLYPGKHTLHIDPDNNLYTVQLTLLTG